VVGDAAALPSRDEAFGLVVAYMCPHDIDRSHSQEPGDETATWR
jgi:hypothetical protein